MTQDIKLNRMIMAVAEIYSLLGSALEIRGVVIPSWQDSEGRESRSMRTQSSLPFRACSLYGMVNVADIILPLKCSDDTGPKSCSEEP